MKFSHILDFKFELACEKHKIHPFILRYIAIVLHLEVLHGIPHENLRCKFCLDAMITCTISLLMDVHLQYLSKHIV